MLQMIDAREGSPALEEEEEGNAAVDSAPEEDEDENEAVDNTRESAIDVVEGLDNVVTSSGKPKSNPVSLLLGWELIFISPCWKRGILYTGRGILYTGKILPVLFSPF